MTEWRWLDVFARHLRACALSHGEVVAVLSESASRPELVETSRIAVQMLGGRVYDIVGNRGAIAALASADFVIDCTVEGLLHAPELGAILAGGARVLMVSNEHPENFERYVEDPTLEERVERGVALLEAAAEMRVTSAAGSDLTARLEGAFRAGSSGVATEAGTIAHWPGGLCLAFPAAHCVEGVVVLAPGDINLTFKSYVREAVRLRIEDDHVVAIEGDGLDADLFRSYLAAFGDRESYAVSHLGFGMNRAARWDYLELYDKAQINGTEARAFAGNFLFSTGANENAGRYTAGHFDLPMRNCTIALDGQVVVDSGALQGDLA